MPYIIFKIPVVKESIALYGAMLSFLNDISHGFRHLFPGYFIILNILHHDFCEIGIELCSGVF